MTKPTAVKVVPTKRNAPEKNVQEATELLFEVRSVLQVVGAITTDKGLEALEYAWVSEDSVSNTLYLAYQKLEAAIGLLNRAAAKQSSPTSEA